MTSKKRKLMTSFFVLHPWGFVLFLLLGAGGFILSSAKIRIPVYTTIETSAEKTETGMRIYLQEKEFETGTAVFLYQSRDDHLERVEKYNIENGFLTVDTIDGLPDSGKIYMDIQTGEISLMRHIFTEGGNI